MIKFYENRKIFFTVSIVIMLLGIASIFINGINLSIQFKGGAIIKYSFTGDLDIKEVESLSSKVLNRNTEVQVTEDLATKSKKVVLNLSGNSGLDANEQEELDSALKEKFPNANLQLSESNIVQPFIGKRFLINGMIAIAISSAFIILYV